MDGKFTDNVVSPSDSLEGAHAHAINNTRPFFTQEGLGPSQEGLGPSQEGLCPRLAIIMIL